MSYSQKIISWKMCHLDLKLQKLGIPLQFWNAKMLLTIQLYSDNRGKLEKNLKHLGFTAILHFKASSDLDEEEEGQGSQEGAEFQRGKPKTLKDKFKEKIVEHCKDGAVVFIFISGLQFPFEVS